MNDVRCRASPVFGRFVSGHETQRLACELAGGGRVVPTHDVAGELPAPEPVFPLVIAPVTRVQEQIHRGGPYRAGQRARDGIAHEFHACDVSVYWSGVAIVVACILIVHIAHSFVVSTDMQSRAIPLDGTRARNGSAGGYGHPRVSQLEPRMNAEQDLIADPSNARMVDAWDGNEGAFWVAQAQRLDETLANCHRPFLTAAAVREDDRVLDVGCGNGKATRDVARIAVNGSALGVDLSAQMLAFARETAAAEGLDNVEFRHADAQIFPFESAAFELVISRMGSMFFGDPVAAFANLHRALRPGGRLVLLTWQGITDNEWLTEFRSALAVGRDLPTPPPEAPSPFALCDPQRVRAILDAAGFAGVSFQSLHEPMSFGPDPDDAFDFVSGLTGWMREGLDQADRDAALAALRTTIAAHTGEHGVTYESATWIIQAHKP